MRTKAKKRLLLVVSMVFTGFLVVTIRLSYVMIAQADKYLSLAKTCTKEIGRLRPREVIFMTETA